MGQWPLQPATSETNKLKHAISIIYNDYGDVVSVDAKKKDLRKWGRNTEVGSTATTVMTFPSGITSETLLSTNGITTVISSSASDTQDIDFYEGQTISGSDFTFVRENTNTTLNGQTAVSLPTALCRITRARLRSPAVGNIYFYEGGTTSGGVPTSLTTVHMIIPAGEMQTQKCSTSVSSIDYWIITGATCGVLEKTSSWAQFRIEIKPLGDTYFFPITEWVTATDSSGSVHMLGDEDPYIIVPSNYDVRVVAIANTAGIDCEAGIIGYLAKVLT